MTDSYTSFKMNARYFSCYFTNVGVNNIVYYRRSHDNSTKFDVTAKVNIVRPFDSYVNKLQKTIIRKKRV